MRPEHNVSWLNLISLLHREERYKEAEEIHQKALEINPDFDDFADDIKEYVENIDSNE